MQLRADNERLRRTMARNGLQDNDVETSDHSPDGDTGRTASLSIGDPTTFGLLFIFYSPILVEQNR